MHRRSARFCEVAQPSMTMGRIADLIARTAPRPRTRSSRSCSMGAGPCGWRNSDAQAPRSPIHVSLDVLRAVSDPDRTPLRPRDGSARATAIRSKPLGRCGASSTIARHGHQARGTKTISGRPVARTMDYPPRVRAVLDRANASQGDTVVVHAKSEPYQGTLMPHHGFSGEDILTLKLPNGYNIGIAVGDIESVEVVSKQPATRAEPRLPSPTRDKPTVAVLGTGGTIASYVDYRTGAVHPAVTPEELVFSVPELPEGCNVRARVIYSIYSENLKPENWQRLAREAAKEIDSGAAGVVIPHGTDTLHFTTAALSFMLRDLMAPVVVVGAQRSSDRPSSDAAMDLKVALVYFYPGQRASELEASLAGVHGAVIAGTGLGHVSHDLIPILHRAVRDGVAVVMATQTLQGRVNMRVYDTGRDLMKAGVISAEDMTPETAYVKLMWILGHTREPPEVARAMATNVAGEINPRIGLDEFAE